MKYNLIIRLDNFLFQNMKLKKLTFLIPKKTIFDKANIKISQGDVIGITYKNIISKFVISI